MEIQEQGNVIEAVTMSDILNLTPSWDRERSTDELLGFVARRRAALTEEDEED